MATKQINLSGLRWGNWSAETNGAEPPVVLNPKASVQACIAWCYSAVGDALELSARGMAGEVEKNSTDDDLILERLTCAKAMLEHLGDVTCNMPSLGGAA
jgi:hypothetical protein